MDDNAFTPKLRGQVFSAVTGRRGDVTGGAGGSLTDKLLAAFGPGKRGATVDAQAAAKALGVTPRTVQRWVRGDSKPRPANAQALTKRARQSATTRPGRRSAMAATRGDRASRYGARLRLNGTQGPRDYERVKRSSQLDLSPEMVNTMRDAYEAGGDKGLVTWATDALDENYVSDWNIIDITDIGFDPL